MNRDPDRTAIFVLLAIGLALVVAIFISARVRHRRQSADPNFPSGSLSSRTVTVTRTNDPVSEALSLSKSVLDLVEQTRKRNKDDQEYYQHTLKQQGWRIVQLMQRLGTNEVWLDADWTTNKMSWGLYFGTETNELGQIRVRLNTNQVSWFISNTIVEMPKGLAVEDDRPKGSK